MSRAAVDSRNKPTLSSAGERGTGTQTDDDLGRNKPYHRRGRGRVRLAVISTPRSGNTWFRLLLHSAFGLEERGVHNPSDLEWSRLPERFVLQLHWPPTEALRQQLTAHGFQPITLARHPLGVLISILHYVPNHPKSARWLEGTGGDERSIVGALPRSGAFLKYATGSRAAALLNVSRDWWMVPGTCQVRYEDLVADPVVTLERLSNDLGIEPVVPLAEAVEAFSIGRLRDARRDQHAWRGDPDLWKTLLPAAEARQICQTHDACMRTLGYQCDADATLEPAQADLNWLNAEFATLWDHVNRVKDRLAALVEAEERRQLGVLGRLKRSLSARFPRAVGWLKMRLLRP
ncbi:MAG: hypothetical protein K2Y37_12600 [Pirellulales bacterium]|nr:hypothetical protein [Pirellulales bacterium]